MPIPILGWVTLGWLLGRRSKDEKKAPAQAPITKVEERVPSFSPAVRAELLADKDALAPRLGESATHAALVTLDETMPELPPVREDDAVFYRLIPKDGKRPTALDVCQAWRNPKDGSKLGEIYVSLSTALNQGEMWVCMVPHAHEHPVRTKISRADTFARLDVPAKPAAVPPEKKEARITEERPTPDVEPIGNAVKTTNGIAHAAPSVAVPTTTTTE